MSEAFDIARAAKIAEAAEEAQKLVMEAGKGLSEVYSSCRANAATLETIAKLQVIQGYLTEAAVVLLEAHIPPKIALPH